MRVEINESAISATLAGAPVAGLGRFGEADLARLRDGAGGLRSIVETSPLAVPPRIIMRELRKKLRAGMERWIYGTRELCIYVVQLEVADRLPNAGLFNVNSIDDLLCYQRTSLSQPPRADFLKMVEERLSRGLISFTYVEDGILRAYMWLDPNPEPYFGSGVDQEIEVVPDAAYVQDAYTDPAVRSKGLAQAGFMQLVNEAEALTGKKQLYFAIFSWNKISRYGAKKLGGHHLLSYFCQTRLGFRKTWKKIYKPELVSMV